MKQKLLKSLKQISKALTKNSEIENALALLEREIESQIVNEVMEKGLAPMKIEDVVKTNPQAIALYSDGACRGNPGPGAWAMLLQEQDDVVLLEESEFINQTTNNQMELSGVISGLEIILQQYPFKNFVHVYTDSKYVVEGMKSWVHGWKARGWKKSDNKAPENLELWQKLDELSKQFNKVEFHWIKGHAGHPQNERCDELANLMMDENLSSL